LSDALLASFPLPQRLALSYAPARAREATRALLALDVRLGQAIRQASEPIMAQMRLAWWRDQLRLPGKERERSDEAVAALDHLEGSGDALLRLVDGWEVLVADQFDAASARQFADARARAFASLARLLGAPDRSEIVLSAGRRWALADLAAGMSRPEECSIALEIAREDFEKRAILSRSLRPLAVLEGLAHRSIARGGAGLLQGPASGLLAMRMGLFGR
jgi:phytoene synthase